MRVRLSVCRSAYKIELHYASILLSRPRQQHVYSGRRNCKHLESINIYDYVVIYK